VRTAAPDLLAWATAASAALLTVFLLRRGGRRRSAINEAIHELRRPLQALALSAPASSPGVGESSMRLAAAALERLELAVNGGDPGLHREPVRCDELLRTAVARWQIGAAVEGGELALRSAEAGAVVAGDPAELGQALDNLIVNAIEHGGARIVVESAVGQGGVRLMVSDFGPRPRAALRGDPFTVAVERFSGRRRRGHGLAVVRRTAARHGGRFVLEHASGGSRAVLELPTIAGHRSERAG
jgi:two-component system sensor histidine kinase BaeS